MKHFLGSLVFLALLALPCVAQPEAVEADVVLKNATVHDGSGQPGKVGDVAIKGDRVVAVGQFKVKGSPKVYDCTGLILAPGFIDLHTHSDVPLTQPATRGNLNYLKQGVT